MARVCVVCVSYCVYFLIFAAFRLVFTAEDYYFYDTESSFKQGYDEFIKLNLVDGNHHVQKRHVLNTTLHQLINETISNNDSVSTELMPSTTAIPEKNLNNKIGKLQKPVQNVTLAKDLQKNLGENGTGIRKNYTPPIPVLQEKILAKPVTIDNTTLTRTTEPEEDYFLPPIEEIEENDEEINMTLFKHNVTEVKMETHTYYNSTIITTEESGQHYWVPDSSAFITNELLSKTHRRAATVKLSFEFPFYGHLVRNVTVATGGFIYTGDYVHSWLAATQYIAPLMANFDTSLSNDSLIKYRDNGTAFTVQWEKVALQDKPKDGQFSFQATIHKNGDIVFVYQNVPPIIKNMQDNLHPVKVGLSDAYIMDHEDYHVRRKTIYEYHRVNFPKEEIKNWTLIYLRALPTCLDHKTCQTCLTNEETNFQCIWCPATKRCSTGMDRLYQEWLLKGCIEKQVSNASDCLHVYNNNDNYNDDFAYVNHQVSNNLPLNSGQMSPNIITISPKTPVQMGVSGILAILFIIAMVAGLGMWVIYAYRNPHTTSGQILIRYRPSQWRWRRGEARYTAATIHM